MDTKKYNLIVIIWGVVLIVLQLFSLINIITHSSILAGSKFIPMMISISMLILLVLFLILSLMKKKAGLIIGIVAGAVYCTSFSIVTIVIAVCFIVSCASLIKELNKES